MVAKTVLGGHLGKRIEGYRNSVPRCVKVLGIGESARRIVSGVNRAHLKNVITAQKAAGPRLHAIDEPVDGLQPNAVIIVYRKGEDASFPFLIDRTASMLSLVIIDGDTSSAETSPRIRQLQAIADLYVTTSDNEFVAELVENLAN
ncbi:MAG: hypothetical protein AB1490_08440 [Pseudomonadota bacterium]